MNGGQNEHPGAQIAQPGLGNHYVEVAAPSAIAERRAPHQHHGTVDCYSVVVTRLSGDWRVIVCHDALQWILQRQKGQRGGRGRWVAVQYFRTRGALLRISHHFSGRIDPAALLVLAARPDRIGGAA